MVEALDMPEDWEVFLDPETGEIIAVTEEERFSLEAEEQDPDDLPDWEEDALAQASVVTHKILDHEGRSVYIGAHGQRDPGIAAAAW